MNHAFSRKCEIILSKFIYQEIKNLHKCLCNNINQKWEIDDTIELLVKFVLKDENEEQALFELLNYYFADKSNLKARIGIEIFQSIHNKTEIFSK